MNTKLIISVVAGLLIAGFSIEHIVAELRSTEVQKLWN